jgi:hypothetical protein
MTMKVKEEERRDGRGKEESGVCCVCRCVVCVCFARFEILREEELISSLAPSLSLSLPPGCLDLIGIGISILGLDFFSLLFSSAFLFQNLIELCFLEKRFSLSLFLSIAFFSFWVVDEIDFFMKQELGQERCDDSEQRSAAGFEKGVLFKEKFCLQWRF